MSIKKLSMSNLKIFLNENPGVHLKPLESYTNIFKILIDT